MRAIDELDGLVSPAVGQTLATLANTIPPDLAIVQIGTYKGKSACYLAQGEAHVWAVDTWDLPGGQRHATYHYNDPMVFYECQRQIKSVGLENRITLVRSTSIDAANEWEGPGIGLLFIDGNHRYEHVVADAYAWQRHLASDAIVIFDDWGTKNREVAPAVDDLGWGDYEVSDDRLAIFHF